jgi:hypothetical protein
MSKTPCGVPLMSKFKVTLRNNYIHVLENVFMVIIVIFFLQNDGSSSKETEENKTRNNRYETACSKLANEAVLRFSGDNVTVLLLAIRKCR